MPEGVVYLLEGRSLEQKRGLVTVITQAVVNLLHEAPEDSDLPPRIFRAKNMFNIARVVGEARLDLVYVDASRRRRVRLLAPATAHAVAVGGGRSGTARSKHPRSAPLNRAFREGLVPQPRRPGGLLRRMTRVAQ